MVGNRSCYKWISQYLGKQRLIITQISFEADFRGGLRVRCDIDQSVANILRSCHFAAGLVIVLKNPNEYHELDNTCGRNKNSTFSLGWRTQTYKYECGHFQILVHRRKTKSLHIYISKQTMSTKRHLTLTGLYRSLISG